MGMQAGVAAHGSAASIAGSTSLRFRLRGDPDPAWRTPALHAQVPLHTLHTSAANWPSPERFWPERWAPDQAARGGPKNGAPTSGPGSAYLPFGSACLSARAAELQVHDMHNWSGRSDALLPIFPLLLHLLQALSKLRA